MKAIKISAIIAGLLLAPVNSGLAEPTVEETKKFITARAKQCKDFTAERVTTEIIPNIFETLIQRDYNVQISFVNDEVHTKETYRKGISYIDRTKKIGTDDNPHTEERYHRTDLGIAKLKDLSPMVEVKDAQTFDSENQRTGTISPKFVLKCSAGDCWKYEERGDGEVVPAKYKNGKVVHDSTGEWYLHTCDFDSAQRLAKAFTHLIKKSGGKEPLF